MALLNGLQGRNTRQDALAAAPVTHHVMVDNATGENHPVGLGHHTVHGHFGPPAGLPVVDHVIRIPRIVVNHPDTVADRFTAQFDKLFGCVLSVGADGDDNGDVIIRDASIVQVIDQDRESEVVALPAAGDIAYRNGHGLARLDDFAQRGAVNGMRQGVPIGGG
jgi:hypothetical protein